MTEQTRDALGNDEPVTHWPDHFAEMTWHRCIVEGCTARLDPWLHKTRCPAHQRDEDRRKATAHAIVRTNLEAERRKVEARER
jgi:hypothetical protein